MVNLDFFNVMGWFASASEDLHTAANLYMENKKAEDRGGNERENAERSRSEGFSSQHNATESHIEPEDIGYRTRATVRGVRALSVLHLVSARL